MKPVLIIGAGPTGLAAARALKSSGILYSQVEADTDVGGNWFHGAYESAFVLACKDVMQYPEFPMPSSYPDFPSFYQMRDYYRSYAEHFGLYDHIRFNKKVTWVQPVENNEWKVYFNDHTNDTFRCVLVCNGHHWSRRFPDYPGKFSGEYFHSKDYKDPEQLKGRRVLVIGAGNSGCDIVCESARVGKKAVLSMRRSVWIFPKSFMGKPLGRIQLPALPSFVEKKLIHFLIKLTFGNHSDYGLPKPSYDFYERHPTVSEELPAYLRQGRVKIVPDIKRFIGNKVEFTDGNMEEFDTIVAATGYNLDFPFLSKEISRVSHSHLNVMGYSCYEDYIGLFFPGWPQVRGGIGSLVSPFSDLLCKFIELEDFYEIPMGSILKEMGEKYPASHLMGARDFFRWMKKMNAGWNRVELIAGRLRDERQFTMNPVLPNPPMEKLNPDLVVY